MATAKQRAAAKANLVKARAAKKRKGSGGDFKTKDGKTDWAAKWAARGRKPGGSGVTDSERKGRYNPDGSLNWGAMARNASLSRAHSRSKPRKPVVLKFKPSDFTKRGDSPLKGAYRPKIKPGTNRAPRW